MKPREVIEREKEWRARIEKELRQNEWRANKLTEQSGIYIFRRDDETGLRFAYVGQAINMAQRILQHCMGYKQRIEISIKKRGFRNEGNPFGWTLEVIYLPEEELNDEERWWTVCVGKDGYQLYNKTGGGQDAGKVQINEYKPARGYRDGLAQGYKNAQKEIAPLFEKYLVAEKAVENRYAEAALEKFKNFIKS